MIPMLQATFHAWSIHNMRNIHYIQLMLRVILSSMNASRPFYIVLKAADKLY